MILEQLDTYARKKNFQPLPHTIYKNYLTCIPDLNINSKTMKLVGEKLYFPDLDKYFLDHTKH